MRNTVLPILVALSATWVSCERAGPVTPGNMASASPTGAPPAQVQARFARGNVEISAPIVPLDEGTLQRADMELRNVSAFMWDFGFLHRPFSQSEGERAVSVILGSTNALERLEAVFTNATPAGQLYALCGIHKLAPARFAALSKPLTTTNLTVDVMHGCFVYAGNRMATSVTDIAAGEYDKRIQAWPWRWTDDGTTNGVWRFAPSAGLSNVSASP